MITTMKIKAKQKNVKLILPDFQKLTVSNDSYYDLSLMIDYEFNKEVFEEMKKQNNVVQTTTKDEI